MNFLSLFRRFRPRSVKANPIPSSDKIADSTSASYLLSNEANVIAHIRSLIPQLKAMGIQNRQNHLLQWEEYIQDIDAPAKPSRFTELEESNRDLHDRYELILAEINQHIRIYDHYCEQHRLDYSPEWNQLLTDLRWYLRGISGAGSLHQEEAYKGFVKPSTRENNQH